MLSTFQKKFIVRWGTILLRHQSRWARPSPIQINLSSSFTKNNHFRSSSPPPFARLIKQPPPSVFLLVDPPSENTVPLSKQSRSSVWCLASTIFPSNNNYPSALAEIINEPRIKSVHQYLHNHPPRSNAAENKASDLISFPTPTPEHIT